MLCSPEFVVTRGNFLRLWLVFTNTGSFTGTSRFTIAFISTLTLFQIILILDNENKSTLQGANIFLTEELKTLKLGDFGCAVKIKAHTTMPGELQVFEMVLIVSVSSGMMMRMTALSRLKPTQQCLASCRYY